jgi:hypothetical protein
VTPTTSTSREDDLESDTVWIYFEEEEWEESQTKPSMMMNARREKGMGKSEIELGI